MKTHLLAISSLVLLAIATTTVSAETYQVTLTNNLEDELLAPVLITSKLNDNQIFSGDYVTAEAEDQILTGAPDNLAIRIGEAGGQSFIAHSTKHASGVLLEPGATITFEITTDVQELRVLAMIAPTKTPDNYVSNVIVVGGDSKIASRNLIRYDIGNNEGRRTIKEVDDGDEYAAKIVIVTK